MCVCVCARMCELSLPSTSEQWVVFSVSTFCQRFFNLLLISSLYLLSLFFTCPCGQSRCLHICILVSAVVYIGLPFFLILCSSSPSHTLCPSFYFHSFSRSLALSVSVSPPLLMGVTCRVMARPQCAIAVI